ncbi:hypothetical protein C2S51_004931 [Perilla frutescens var. frutescens]|nr:hypothetical protein C2S51_004931 [Perilla frutescens var. frutescens]
MRRRAIKTGKRKSSGNDGGLTGPGPIPSGRHTRSVTIHSIATTDPVPHPPYSASARRSILDTM